MTKNLLAAILAALAISPESMAAPVPNSFMLTSGVGVNIVTRGVGKTPNQYDSVLVKYTGKLPNGKVFDSSNGGPIALPLTGVIQCWRDALTNLRSGTTAVVMCPSSTAYGAAGSPPKIAPYTDLTFEIELMAVIPYKK